LQHSEQFEKISEALAAAQSEIKPAAKDSENPYHKAKYADLASVIEALRPLSRHGLSYTQTAQPLIFKTVTIRQKEKRADGQEARTASGPPVQLDMAFLPVETTLLHTSGQWISSTLEMPLPGLDPQGLGSAFTYGRRYGLQAIAGVSADDDDAEQAMARRQKSLPEMTTPGDGEAFARYNERILESFLPADREKSAQRLAAKWKELQVKKAVTAGTPIEEMTLRQFVDVFTNYRDSVELGLRVYLENLKKPVADTPQEYGKNEAGAMLDVKTDGSTGETTPEAGKTPQNASISISPEDSPEAAAKCSYCGEMHPEREVCPVTEIHRAKQEAERLAAKVQKVSRNDWACGRCKKKKPAGTEPGGFVPDGRGREIIVCKDCQKKH
jgi:hypothetical protein